MCTRYKHGALRGQGGSQIPWNQAPYVCRELNKGPPAKSSKCFQPLSHFSSPKVQPRNKLKLRAS